MAGKASWSVESGGRRDRPRPSRHCSCIMRERDHAIRSATREGRHVPARAGVARARCAPRRVRDRVLARGGGVACGPVRGGGARVRGGGRERRQAARRPDRARDRALQARRLRARGKRCARCWRRSRRAAKRDSTWRSPSSGSTRTRGRSRISRRSAYRDLDYPPSGRPRIRSDER